VISKVVLFWYASIRKLYELEHRHTTNHVRKRRSRKEQFLTGKKQDQNFDTLTVTWNGNSVSLYAGISHVENCDGPQERISRVQLIDKTEAGLQGTNKST
jgi:hypothetical protein